ncbi:replication initiator protein A [Clostridium sp. ZS2-4]|uniref:replication initiator protein A n=1 Tax=Clostridium sp. ZS2-4 TaxID=2987703 RepID=UPI00227D6DF3|nr:replication initiator protein A [Clostridium sp. ZS2-4]MCY6355383.1 replication initiator protein A [Clostridium sp. ZS2-4]
MEIKKEDKKNKVIKSNSSIIDNNIIESPLFISSSKEITTVGQLESNSIVSTSVKKVLKMLKENFTETSTDIDYEKFPVVYKVWNDSKGMKRELLIMSSIPNMTTMDVWNGLIGLYIQKLSPICFNSTENTYDLNNDEMEFTLYELAKFMNKSIGGKSFDKLVKEIIRLYDAKYFTFTNGVIFDKKNDKYLKTKTKSFSLITDCELDSEKRVKNEKVKTKCKVQFNRLIIDNIRHEFFKYINPKEYFTLPSRGLTRRVYMYLKGNSHLPNGHRCRYIKRSYQVIRDKLYIYEHQPSKIKEKLKNPLNYLKKFNVISDYFFGDEILVNGVKEQCVYFIFQGTKEDTIKKITYKQIETISGEEDLKFKMEIPEDLWSFLVHKGFSEVVSKEILYKYDKWEIVKYILWLQEKEFENKKSVKNFPGMLRFALESGTVNLEKTHKHIIDFVDHEKAECKNNQVSKEEALRKQYEKYIKKEILDFKKDDEAAYDILFETVLDNLNASYESRMREFNLFENEITENEREKWEYQKQKWIKFKEKQSKSKLFLEQFEKAIVSFRNLKLYEDFTTAAR